MKYSKELIDQLKKVFKEEHDLEFTDDQAVEALDNLSGLFLVFSEIENKYLKSIASF